ncbi:hypothetical protein [Bordetella bronchialis]|uniref:Uncharacterized protein n=1 Tax=Bordetella bronchialis TaxID=463025 RepID=A0A193FM22_9BORD|nr:hypothetical protein [Bordetella bronchialis]ANN68303.1 hypothetical protein BAU06_20155 [Bordetella bronchialis]ANN73443.1 hypothetical protein BAU08_20685 [Bordetella bronchialis]
MPVPPVPSESGLTRFLRTTCIEVQVNRDLEPVIRVSALQDPVTFDAVLHRSRSALREAAAQGGDRGAVFLAAVHVLDRDTVLRNQSRTVRNALYQG